VGFDISCGVRTLLAGVNVEKVERVKKKFADALAAKIPAGVGSTGRLRLEGRAMDAMLSGGALWAVEQGYGREEDLGRVEEGGRMAGARPEEVSAKAKKRQANQVGTLGSGNHYLEVQYVTEVYDAETAAAFGLAKGDVTVSIHCGSRGLGHQIGTDFLKRMAAEAPRHGIRLPDRELACAPIESPLGRSYLGAMRAGINCALANRQVLTHLTRQVLAALLPDAGGDLLYDVSHNTCKVEEHRDQNGSQRVFVHRKGATRACGPGHPDLPPEFRDTGQPVLVGGTMGTASYVLAGGPEGAGLSWNSACHGAGRAMSRSGAKKRWRGREVVDHLAKRGILIRSSSMAGIAEEAPGAYKDVTAVIEATERSGLARTVVRLEPLICVKG
jgi:tRNA-splicing ligase RtcB